MPQPNDRDSTIMKRRLAQYDRLIATQAGLERKGAKMPYTSVSGNMSSFLAESGTLVLRLSPEERERFMATYDSGLHEAHGRVMKEFVRVPDALFDEPADLSEWFGSSCRYTASLKPKPSRRR